MKNYHPCPKCYDRRPIELSDIEAWDNPDITSVLRCQKCGFIYRIGKDGKSLDTPEKIVYSKKIRELSHDENLIRIFRYIEENKRINMGSITKGLKTDDHLIRKDVSELERNRILDVRYLGSQRILAIAETKAADLFKELIQE